MKRRLWVGVAVLISLATATGWFSVFMAWFRALTDRDAGLVMLLITAGLATVGWLLSQFLLFLVGKLWSRLPVIQLLIQIRRQGLPTTFPADGYLRVVDVGREEIIPTNWGMREFRNPAGAPIWWDGKSEPQARWMQSARCEVTNLSGLTLAEASLDILGDFYDVVRLSDTQTKSGKRLLRRRFPVQMTNVKPDTPFIFYITNRDTEVFAALAVEPRAHALVAGEAKSRRVQIIQPKSALPDKLGMLLPSSLKGIPATSTGITSEGNGTTVVTIDGEAIPTTNNVKSVTTQ